MNSEDFEKEGEEAKPPSKLTELILPCDSYTIEQSGKVIYPYFKENGLFFRQGVTLKRIHPEATDGEWLETIKAETFRGILGTHFACKTIIQGNRGDYTTRKLCSADKARALLASDTISILDPIQAVLMCPIFVEDTQGGLKVLGKGYHPENGGTYVITDETIDENIGIEEATKALLELIEEFLFVTSSDRSRCLAGLLAPAFRFGQLLKADFPLQIYEASVEQTGKTHLVKLIKTLYNERPFPVTGADKLDEKLSTAMLSGAGMILLDNIRSLLNSELFESAVRGEGTVSARKAYAPVVKAPTNHIIWLATSNKAAVSPDLAARSLITRLKKQPANYTWKVYPDGSHLQHVVNNRGYFLSCIFAFLREWHKAGKPKTSPVEHDFREFCGVLDWCVTQLAKQAGLLLGHRDEQMRLSNPDLNWMRDVAIEVERIERLNERLKTNEIIKICDDATIPIIGLERWDKSPDRDVKLPALLGQQLKRLFKKSTDGHSLMVGGYKVEREETEEYSSYRRRTETIVTYTFMIV